MMPTGSWVALRLALCAALLAIAGCASYQPGSPFPMGLSQEEWQALSPEDKFKYA